MARKKKAASPTARDARIFLWDLAGGAGAPSVAATFADEREAAEWLASDPSPFRREPAAPRAVMDDLNVTRKDERAYFDLDGRRRAWTRRWTFTRADGTTWDPRVEAGTIAKIARERANEKPRPRNWNAAYLESLGWKWRKGKPVPRTGRATRGGLPLRKRRYFRAARLAADAEAGRFVRKKAIPPDLWEKEEFECRPRCWKDQSKRKRQPKAYGLR